MKVETKTGSLFLKKGTRSLSPAYMACAIWNLRKSGMSRRKSSLSVCEKMLTSELYSRTLRILSLSYLGSLVSWQNSSMNVILFWRWEERVSSELRRVESEPTVKE